MRCTVLALSAMAALSAALPAVHRLLALTSRSWILVNTRQPLLIDTKPGSTIELGKPSTEMSWGKRDSPESDDTIELGKPSTEITWGKRDLIDVKPGSTIELGKPSTEVTWGKE